MSQGEASDALAADHVNTAKSLAAVLRIRAKETPDKHAVIFGKRQVTFFQLHRRARRFAAFLQEFGVGRGDRVVLCLPNSSDFFFAFYGIQLLGGVAVPLFPGLGAERLARTADHCGAVAILYDSFTGLEKRASLTAHWPESGPCLLDMADGLTHAGDTAGNPTGDTELAMLQYTSGSTGNPKGVMLTHRNLLANVRQIIPAAGLHDQDVFVSWLPLYHDMGLITMTMCPLYLGATLVLLPTSPKPYPWLTAIQTHGGTFTAAPDFGFRFCTKFSKAGHHYDLSSLRQALIAGEPVRAKTISDFEKKFSLPGVLKPGYGLAEASVGASYLAQRDVPVQTDKRGHVPGGWPLPGLELAIAKGDGFAPQNVQGEIVMRGPNCTHGYFRNAEATRALQFRDGYIRTGDIGYLDNQGQIFIVGRAKQLIIRAGRNISPRELEEEAESLKEIRLSAATGLEDPKADEEQVAVFAEVGPRDIAEAGKAYELAMRLSRRCYTALKMRPDYIFFLKPRSIPRTYNGKIQYASLKKEFATGALARQILYTWPETGDHGGG